MSTNRAAFTPTYLYEVVATDVVAPIHTVSVGNPYMVEFTDAQNWGAIQKPFTNPQYLPWMDSVLRVDGIQLSGETSYLEYVTTVEPMVVDMSVLNGGWSAHGTTLGMVPEPGLCFGLAGVFLRAFAVGRRRLTR
jgi:hypothetical protein